MGLVPFNDYMAIKNQSLSTLVNMGFAFLNNHNVLVIPSTLSKCKWLK